MDDKNIMDYTKYDTFRKRFLAGFYDSFIFIPVAILESYILNEKNSIFLIILWLPISFLLPTVYSIYFNWKYGQTVGKMITRIQILDVSEEKGLTLRQAIIRDSVPAVSDILELLLSIFFIISTGSYSRDGIRKFTVFLGIIPAIWFTLEIVTMLFNKKGRALHDYLAGTVVVDTDIVRRVS